MFSCCHPTPKEMGFLAGNLVISVIYVVLCPTCHLLHIGHLYVTNPCLIRLGFSFRYSSASSSVSYAIFCRQCPLPLRVQ